MRNSLLQFKSFLLIIGFLAIATIANAQNRPFITVWKTDNPGTSEDNQITIPGTGTDYLIEWEEVGNEASNSGSETGTDEHTVTFPSAGTYRVKISGGFSRIEFRNQRDKEKILDIEQWGDIAWSSFNRAFWGCSNLNHSSTDAPDLSNLTNMSLMFYGASSFNGDIGNWNVANVTNMIAMFRDASSFNGEIGGWDVSNVTDMSRMFAGSNDFNQDISTWDVSNVKDMTGVFANAKAFNMPLGTWNVSNVETMEYMFAETLLFNQNISQWNISNVKNMTGMFAGSRAFNQSLNGWDVSEVNTMRRMFYEARSFNGSLASWDMSSVSNLSEMFARSILFDQDISNWDVSAVVNMESMFEYARAFNQNLGSWDISNTINLNHMLHESNLTGAAYDSTLIGWAKLESKPKNVYLGNINGQFCNSIDARSHLINQLGWTIYGDYYCDKEKFILRCKSDNSGTSNSNQFSFPAIGTNYLIEWEYVNDTTINGQIIATNNQLLTFPVSGEYRLRISGNINSVKFNNEGDKDKILSVDNWGSNYWIDLSDAFYGCKNLEIKAADLPVLDSVTDLSNTFRESSIVGRSLETWETSNIKNLSNTFFNAENFNADLNKWDVSSVVDFTNLFNGANKFDFALSDWDISQASDMEGFFNYTSLSTDNYVETLKSWNESSNTPANIVLGAEGISYCDDFARNELITNALWDIQGDYQNCSNQFITVWQTDSVGISEDNQIILKGRGSNYTIEWEEVGNEEHNKGRETATNQATLTFPNPGRYRVKISGDFKNIFFTGESDSKKLISIEQWGTIKWKSFESAFYDCSNLKIVATDKPNLENVRSMAYMFYNAQAFNTDISTWDVKRITDMNFMFSGALSFNADISGWDVRSLNNANFMFYGAESFNQNLGGWIIGNLVEMDNMLSYTNLSTYNYDQTLIGWSKLETLNKNIDLGAFECTYCISSNDREYLKNDMNWHIYGDEIDCETQFFRSIWKTDNEGISAANQIQLPLRGNSYLILWKSLNDTTVIGREYAQNSHLLVLPDPGIYELKIYGNVNRFNFSNEGDKLKLMEISNWGEINWTTMNSSFAGAANLEVSAVDSPDLSNVSDLSYMFYKSHSMNTDISSWDVSSVTNMTEMFREAKAFNQDISSWNTANVTDISGMFYEATSFDQNLGDWDLSNAGSLFEFLTNSGLSVQNYDATLEGWATNGTIPRGIALSAEGLAYCASDEFRQKLIDDFGWGITGDVQCSLVLEETFPAAEATKVEKNTEIHLTFDQTFEEIDFSNIELSDVSGNSVTINNVVADSLTLRIIHNGLGFNTYEVTIPENTLVSASGKVNDEIKWSFATQSILASKDKQLATNLTNYPNPFSDYTTLRFSLTEGNSFDLLVYDLKGQLVRQESFDNRASGEQSIKFERKGLPTGLYHYQIQATQGAVSGKMMIK